MIKLRSRPRARSIWPSKISRNSARLTIRLAELCEAPTILKSKSSAVGFHQSPGSRRAAPGSHDRIGGDITPAPTYIMGEAELFMIDPFGRTISYPRVSVTD